MLVREKKKNLRTNIVALCGNIIEYLCELCVGETKYWIFEAVLSVLTKVKFSRLELFMKHVGTK